MNENFNKRILHLNQICITECEKGIKSEKNTQFLACILFTYYTAYIIFVPKTVISFILLFCTLAALYFIIESGKRSSYYRRTLVECLIKKESRPYK